MGGAIAPILPQAPGRLPCVSRLGPALVVVSGRSRLAGAPVARAALVDAVVAAVRARGHGPVDVAVSEGAAMVDRAVRAAVVGGAALVVAVGGDGLVREVGGALAGHRVNLGIVPAGTGNLLASALRIPGATQEALRIIAEAEPRRVDQGIATWAGGAAGAGSGSFLVACGAGLDARLVGRASHDAKRRFGIAAYMGAALATAADLRPRPTRLVVDGTVVETRSVVVLVANAGELIPGMLGPRHPVLPDDGLLDVFVVHGGILGSLRGTLELLAASGPRAGRAGVRLQGREVRVDVAPPVPIQLDGDVLGASPLEARVVPAALSVLAPPRG